MVRAGPAPRRASGRWVERAAGIGVASMKSEGHWRQENGGDRSRAPCAGRTPVAAAVPSIRAGVLSPILRWMVERGLSVEAALRDAGLGASIAEDPNAIAPVLTSVELLRRVGRTEGPDVFCRIGARADFGEVGAIGAMALAQPSPRAALAAIVAFMPRHSTHERIDLADTPDGLRFIDRWDLPLDAEALHFVHQYVAALFLAICRASDAPAPLISRVEITPHPVAGVAHLQPWFGRVEAAAAPRLVIDIPARVANARMRRAVGATGQPPSRLLDPAGEDDFLRSLRWTIDATLDAGPTSIGDVAAAAGLSARTLQRRLAGCGVTFSDLIDEARRETALRLIATETMAASEVAARLGYANASALSRAVRRWTGETPTAIRARACALKRMRRNATTLDGAKR